MKISATLIFHHFAPAKFFKDDKGKIYFYDYNTSNAYEVGKELGENVYK